MASQATLDKANALRERITANQAKVTQLKALSDQTSDIKRQIRGLNNQISNDQYQFRTDNDLLGLAGEKMSAGDKLGVFGLATGTLGGAGTPAVAAKLVGTAAAVKQIENITNTNPKAETTLADAPSNAPTADPTPVYDPLPNKLHEYATYTYGISLHLLTKEEYNAVVRSEEYTPKRVLVASAGRYNTLGEEDPNSLVRNKYFSRDFYFDNLEITTIIGNTEFNRMTNAVDINFTLIEPYGITFLNNLISACADPEVGSPNYLDMPYLIELNFFANSDAGELINKIPGLTKRFPVMITKMDVKASVKGSEYKIKAQPFNHSAYQSTTVGVPVAVTVVAGTVAEFFQSGESAGVPVELQDNSRDTSKSTLYRLNNNQFANNGQVLESSTIPTINLSKASVNRLRQVSSFGSALNDWYRELRDNNKLETNDEYFFEFDPEIANSQFSSITNNTTDPKNTRMANKDNTISIRLASATQKGTDDFNRTLKEFQINAGTTIDKVINTIIRYSDYVQKQILLPEDYSDPQKYKDALEASKSQPLNWFKIVPEIRLGEFDNAKKLWKRYITFHVQKYIITNVKIELGPQGIALYPSKKYDYLYSGANNDILDVDIQFNALYYNTITAFKQKMTAINNVPNKTQENLISNPASYIGSPQDPNSVMPQPTKPTVLNAKNNAAGIELTARDVATGDLEESILTLSDADMVRVNLSILGDPDFIKQDDVFYKPKHLASISGDSTTGTDPRLTPNGSLLTDRGDIHALLTIRTPIDLDETTGRMEFTGDYQLSVFSGLYKVVKVVSTFQSGMFKQVLEMVRLVRQASYDGGTKKETVERTGDASQASDALAIGQNNSVTDIAGGSGSPDAASGEAGDAQKLAQDQQATENVTEGEPTVTEEQKTLMDTNKTAETTSITERNEPQATQPPPPVSTPISEQLPAGVTQNNVGVYQYNGVNIGRVTDANGNDSKNLAIIKNAIDTKTIVTYTWSDPVSGLDKKVTYNGATGQTESIR